MGRYRCISLGMIPVSAVPGVSLVPVVFRLLPAHEPANWGVFPQGRQGSRDRAQMARGWHLIGEFRQIPRTLAAGWRWLPRAVKSGESEA